MGTELRLCDMLLCYDWRAGARKPSHTSGSEFSIYYIYIYITGAAHTVIPFNDNTRIKLQHPYAVH